MFTVNTIRNISAKELEAMFGTTGKLQVVEFAEADNGACEIMAPVVKRVHEIYYQRAEFVRVSLDEHESLRDLYKLFRTPTYLFLKDGAIVDAVPGLVPLEKFLNLVKAYI